MKLYSFPFSPNAKKVQLTLEEIGEPYQLVNVDLSKGEQRQPEYLRLNPNGRVPTLESDGFVLWESNAILYYLAERFPKARLLPPATEARGDVARWLFYQAQHFGPAFATIFRHTMKLPHHTMKLPQDQRDPRRVEEAKTEIARCSTIMNATLASRPYLAGDFSLADLGCAPYLAWAPMLGVGLEAYADLGGWLARLKRRASWKKVYGE